MSNTLHAELRLEDLARITGKPTMPLERELTAVTTAVRTAAQAIRQIASNGFETRHKLDRSLVTAADLEANRILKEILSNAFPHYGWLSEETRDDHTRLACDRVWIVDPMDGTREFTMGIPEFAISVALVEFGEPLVAVVHNPSTAELFAAVRGGGTTRDGEPVAASHRLGERPVIEASRSDIEKGHFTTLEPFLEIRPCGSIAYKLARLSAGSADAVVSLTPKNEWDIAAGVLLVAEAGGAVTSRSGEPFVFNQHDTLVDGVIAASQEAYGEIRSLIDARGNHTTP